MNDAERAEYEAIKQAMRDARVIEFEREQASIKRIDALDRRDPEAAHAAVDEILMSYAPHEVREAVRSLQGRCSWWAGA